MTRFIFISIFFIAMISMTSFTVSANNTKSSSVVISHTKESGSAPVSEPNPGLPVAKTVPPLHPEEKAHTPKMEELPHIHHFHKERVKKAKRHHKKYWTISMLVLVLCHVALLIIAYLHITPH
jgi:hypothetical protein